MTEAWREGCLTWTRGEPSSVAPRFWVVRFAGLSPGPEVDARSRFCALGPGEAVIHCQPFSRQSVH